MAKIPLTISVQSIRCIEETDEVGADEPYVLVFAADLRKKAAGVTVPVAAVELYGPWEDTDKGETKTVLLEGSPTATALKKIAPRTRFSKPFWGIGGKATPIDSPDDVIILVQMMENDDARATDVLSVVGASMVAELTGSVNGNMNRSELAQHLGRKMGNAVEAGRKLGIPNHDDRIGGVKELRLTASDLASGCGGAHHRTMEFSGDGGKYSVRFEIRRA